MLPWDRLPPGADRLVPAVALALLALGLLWSVDAAAHVASYDEVERIDPWGEHGAFSYEPVLADGSGTLPMGEPGYFTTDAPTMRVAFKWQLDDVQARRVTALGELFLRIENEAPPWTHVEALGEGQLDANPGNALEMRGVVDLPATRARIAETTGRDPDAASWSVVASVRFASAPIESHKADASEFALPISYSHPLYSMPGADDVSVTKDHATTRVTHHEERGGLQALLARPAGPILALAGVAALVLSPPRDEEADT